MSSHSRNSRKPIRTLQLAVAAALLAGSVAQADESRNFELTAFSNGTAGAALTSGDYNAALAQLQHSYALQNDTTATNRCVAYSVTRQLQAARAACDAAVNEAQQAIASMPVSMSWARSDYRDYLALAYSNRAVLNWLMNDSAAAQSDLKKAAAVSPKAAFVARNETALESHAKFARVSAR
jgi:tetratricopeptide (TPR) repeat protein